MTALPAIRLVVSDVDGTIVPKNGLPTDKTIEAVRDLHAAGITVALVSSRPPRGMIALIEALEVRTDIAGFNGGLIVRPDLSVIESHPIDPVAAQGAVDLMLGLGLDVWVYTERAWLVRDESAPHIARERNTVRFDPEIVAAFTPTELSHALKIVGVSDEAPLVADAVAKAAASLGDGVNVSSSHPYYAEVTSRDANKGHAVERLSQLRQVPLSAIATIGDGDNDVEMFANCGLSIAMGNASDAVKAKADKVTASNEADGFAAAMRGFVLK